MKIIEIQYHDKKKEGVSKYLGKFKQLVPVGSPEAQSEQAIIARFQRVLDNRFIMLRHLQLEGLGLPIPAILAGPPGLSVINMSSESGFFRAKEDSWGKMEKANKFSQAQPNLIKQTLEFAQKLGMNLDIHGKAHPPITPILIFTRPGVHVESINPAIRIVLMDGVENLLAGILNSSTALRANEINFLSETLEVMANPDKAITLEVGEDFYQQETNVQDEKPASRFPTINIPTEMPLPPIEEKLKFSRKQWIMVALLIFFTIIILLVAIVYIVGTT